MTVAIHHPASIRGVTLIELMIVLAIVGILAAIAVPAYSKYMNKSRRADAQALLMEIATRQELYFTDARSYAPTITALDVKLPANVSKHYTVVIEGTDLTPPTFVARATPMAGSPQNGDGILTIDHTGVKTPSTAW